MKSLFDICLSYISRNLDIVQSADSLPAGVKELLLEWQASHDFLIDPKVEALIFGREFGRNLHRINFYLSDELSDQVLVALGNCNRQLQLITIVHCTKVTDVGIRGITEGQKQLVRIELRGLRNLSSYGIDTIESPNLSFVDLSDCNQISSEGIVQILNRNPTVNSLCLNHCSSLDDVALYAIASYLGCRLLSLELDFLQNIHDPASAISNLTESCPNLSQLSLCRYFLLDSGLDILQLDCQINSGKLRELDFYGNYFSILPHLPDSIITLRLSCSGMENVQDLAFKLLNLPKLANLKLMISCRESGEQDIERLNHFVKYLLPLIGHKITTMQLQVYRITDESIRTITDYCYRLINLSLDVPQLNGSFLYQIFNNPQRAAGIKVLKLSRIQLNHRVLMTISKHCINLEELEMCQMQSIDNRFLKALASRCYKLRCVNFNGCRWVTDKGLCALARACPLKEVRVRATSVTDKCIYILAQFCPQLEWVAHADYTGKPKFSNEALQTLRDSCIQRVIC